MLTDDALVSSVAASVLDGTAVDWAAIESSGQAGSRAVLAQLRVLAAVADVCRAPEQWGHLRLLERIGHGASGDVYRAWDTRLDREVALKLLPAAPSSSTSSIIHEGRLLARVRHANVVTIYGAEQIDGSIGLWMEFVHGRTLKQIVDSGRQFSDGEVIGIGRSVCAALDAVHRAGLLHRDVKAQNVMLAEDGRVVLMDFGAGRELADDSGTDLTGTPLYLAPEIFEGGSASIQSDIYSLGVLLFYLATGSYPVRAQNVRDVRRAHRDNERRSVAAARKDAPLSPKLARIIDRAIQPRAEDRYPTASALATDLDALENRSLRRRAAYPIVLAAIAVLLAGAAWEWLGAHGPRRSAGANAAVAPVLSPVIAVLPLKSLGGQAGAEYFADGLTDEIIRNLASIQGLRVRSRTSSFAFKDKPRNVREVADQLGVNYVVEGSVLRSGNRLRINAQLIEVPDDIPVWSDRFDRELKDVFAIQDEISRAIVNKLRLTLGTGQRRYDAEPEAYDLYLKGNALIAQRGIPSLEKAAALYARVIQQSPAFAPAYAGQANAYALMSAPSSSTMTFAIVDTAIRTAALRALELDPLLADAHAAIGWAYAYEHDWANAEKSFQRAIELNPALTYAYTGYSFSTLEPLGRFDDAQRILGAALKNDPLSLDVLREIGEVHFYASRYRDAAETFQRIRAVDPDFPFVQFWLGRSLGFAGEPDEAIRLLEPLTGQHLGRLKASGAQHTPWLAQVYVMKGRRADAEALAEEHKNGPTAAAVYAALGDKDRAFAALDRMADTQPHHIARLLLNPEMAALRGDPRLREVRQRLGLPQQ